jgi:hypothetical protein
MLFDRNRSARCPVRIIIEWLNVRPGTLCPAFLRTMSELRYCKKTQALNPFACSHRRSLPLNFDADYVLLETRC